MTSYSLNSKPKLKTSTPIGVMTAAPEITRGKNFNLNYSTDPLKTPCSQMLLHKTRNKMGR